MITRNSILLDTDELVYTQYFDISNDITAPINNNNIHRVPIVENNIQDLIPPVIGSLVKVKSADSKAKSFNLDTLQKTIGYQKHDQRNQTL